MHHKRRRPKHQRAGCLLCKPHKDERLPKFLRLKGLKAPRRLAVQGRQRVQSQLAIDGRETRRVAARVVTELVTPSREHRKSF